MRLIDLKEGFIAKIDCILGGRKVNAKLSSLGLMVGTVIKMIRNGKGPVIIDINKNRILIGKGLADKILIEQNNEKKF